MKPRVPHGLLTSERLSILPVLRGEAAIAQATDYLRMCIKHRWFEREDAWNIAMARDEAIWLWIRTAAGGQWCCIQPHEARSIALRV